MKQHHEMETLAKRLRDAREFLGLSQEYVAQQMNVPRPAISKIESGRRKVDSLELIRLSKLYGLPVGYLLGENQAEETAEAIGADPLVGKLRLMTRGLKAEEREEILHFVEYLKHRKTA
ncbi:MAG TPA: helix-turn-helix transcriptional regulator [Candidatus Acidoferrales bacterium]|nr:helix-turn-helix transcriptional regulator [Candidatus Acidoferrales bacterium]